MPTLHDADIQPGQGLLYETLTKTWRAKDCALNSYGIKNLSYGLTPAPCKDCPAGTVASRDLSTSAQYYHVNADGTGGFTDEMACVTKPGTAYCMDVGALRGLHRVSWRPG